jgi:hypothetical protein
MRSFIGGFITTLAFALAVLGGLAGIFLLVQYLTGPIGG